MKAGLEIIFIFALSLLGLCAQEKNAKQQAKVDDDPAKGKPVLLKIPTKSVDPMSSYLPGEGTKKAEADIALGNLELYMFYVEGKDMIAAKSRVFLEHFDIKIKTMNGCMDKRSGSYSDEYNARIYQFIKQKHGKDALTQAHTEVGRLFRVSLENSASIK